MTGQIVQISVSQGGVPKHTIPQAYVSVKGVEGDRQTHLKFHGGPDRAVCLWSLEVIQALQQEGHEIAPGTAGENITLSGLAWATLGPGTQLHLGKAVLLEVTDYTAPCHQIKHCFSDRRFKRISQNHYPGSSRLYARVLSEGILTVNDPVAIKPQL